MKKIQSDVGNPERYRLQMSDGENYQPCMFINLFLTWHLVLRSFSLSHHHMYHPSHLTHYRPSYYHTLTGMLATQMNDKIHSKEVDKYSVVEIEKYLCNTIHERK